MLETKYTVTVFFVCAILSLGHMSAAFLLSQRRFSWKKTALIWVSVFFFFFFIVYLSYSLLSGKLRLLFSLAFSFLYFWINFLYTSSDGLWKKCYLWLTYGTVFCFTWPFSCFLSIIIVPSEYDVYAYILRCVIEVVIVFSLLFLYRKYGMALIKETGSFNSRSWRRLCFVAFIYFLLSLVLLIFILSQEVESISLRVIYIFVVISFVSVNVLSFSNIYYMKKEARDSLVRQNVEYLSSYIENARVMERESRRIRHDSRHHNEIIREMAKNGDNESIIKYLGELDANEVVYTLWCPNIMVSSILSSYKKKAQEIDVEFSASADIPISTGICDIDFVAILANLLENALNATLEAEKKGPIEVKVSCKGNKVIIVVCNPSVSSFKIENGLPLKIGTGIESIITSIKRYDGEIRYTLLDNTCCCCVILAP